jgi:hypothetical protein
MGVHTWIQRDDLGAGPVVKPLLYFIVSNLLFIEEK